MTRRTTAVVLATMVVAAGTSGTATATGTASHLALNDCGLVGTAGAGGQATYNTQQARLAVHVRGVGTADVVVVFADGAELGTLSLGNGGAGMDMFPAAAPPILVEVKNTSGQVLLSSNC
jgi:hypothetical protein